MGKTSARGKGKEGRKVIEMLEGFGKFVKKDRLRAAFLFSSLRPSATPLYLGPLSSSLPFSLHLSPSSFPFLPPCSLCVKTEIQLPLCLSLCLPTWLSICQSLPVCLSLF